jgi:hypothetical protein
MKYYLLLQILIQFFHIFGFRAFTKSALKTLMSDVFGATTFMSLSYFLRQDFASVRIQNLRRDGRVCTNIKGQLLTRYITVAGLYQSTAVLTKQANQLIGKDRLKDKDVFVALVIFDLLVTLLSQEQERSELDKRILLKDGSVFCEIKEVLSARMGIGYQEFLKLLGQAVFCLSGHKFEVPEHQRIFFLLAYRIKTAFSEETKNAFFEYSKFDKTNFNNAAVCAEVFLSAIKNIKIEGQKLNISTSPVAVCNEGFGFSVQYSKHFSGYEYTSLDQAGDPIRKVTREVGFKISDAIGRECLFLPNGAIGVSKTKFPSDANEFVVAPDTLNLTDFSFALFVEDNLLFSPGGDNNVISLQYPEHQIEVLDPVVLIPGKGWSYYHWVAETLPALLMVQEYLGASFVERKVYLPFGEKVWHRQWLDILGLDKLDIEFLDTPMEYRFSNALISTLPALPLLPSRAILLVQERFFQHTSLGKNGLRNGKIIITKNDDQTARKDRHFKSRVLKSHSDAMVCSISQMSILDQALLGLSSEEYFLEGGASNVLMLFACDSIFNVTASEELYYDTFAAFASLTGNKINYDFLQSEFFISKSALWNYGKVL